MVTCTVTHLWISQPNWYLFYKYKKLLSQKQNTCVFPNKYIYNRLCVLEYIVLWIRCHSCCHHREFTSCRTHEQRRGYRGFEMTSQLLPLTLEWKNVTQTKQRRDMRLTSWLTSRLNRVSMIYLCEYDLPWTRTESQVRLCPGPSQVLSQVSSQDCWWIWPQGPASLGPWVTVACNNPPGHTCESPSETRMCGLADCCKPLCPECPGYWSPFFADCHSLQLPFTHQAPFFFASRAQYKWIRCKW